MIILKNTADQRAKTREDIARYINSGLTDAEIQHHLHAVTKEIYVGVIRDLMVAKEGE